MGMNLREMSQTGVFPVVVRTEIDYRKPAVLGDELTIRGHLEKLERVRFWVAFTVERVDGLQLITCRQSLALVQMPQGKPLRLPKEWERFDE
jgi:acyl-CoA thioesterase FadM